MLFDLRGKRKRAIQVIYVGLAVLMGGGLILFGIGGSTSGGLFDAFSDDQSADADPVLENQINRAEDTLASNPNDERALLTLARTHFLAAQNALEKDDQGQPVALTDEAGSEYLAATDAWEKYLATKPKKPDNGVAPLMVQAYDIQTRSTSDPTEFTQALDGALEAAQIVADSRPSVGSLAQVASFAYFVGDMKLAEQSQKRALAEASDDTTRSQVEAQLEQAKAQGQAIAAQLEQAEAQQKQANAAETPDQSQLENPLEGLGGTGAPTPLPGTAP